MKSRRQPGLQSSLDWGRSHFQAHYLGRHQKIYLRSLSCELRASDPHQLSFSELVGSPCKPLQWAVHNMAAAFSQSEGLRGREGERASKIEQARLVSQPLLNLESGVSSLVIERPRPHSLTLGVGIFGSHYRGCLPHTQTVFLSTSVCVESQSFSLSLWNL